MDDEQETEAPPVTDEIMERVLQEMPESVSGEGLVEMTCFLLVRYGVTAAEVSTIFEGVMSVYPDVVAAYEAEHEIMESVQ